MYCLKNKTWTGSCSSKWDKNSVSFQTAGRVYLYWFDLSSVNRFGDVRFSQLFKRLPFFIIAVASRQTRRPRSRRILTAKTTSNSRRERRDGGGRGGEGKPVTKDRKARSSDSERGMGWKHHSRSLRDTGAYEKSDSCNDEGLFVVAENSPFPASITADII